MNKEAIAKVCHEANKAYCEALGDASQPSWEGAPEWQRQSALKGVEHHLTHPDATPADSHNSWLAEKKAAGWKYGPVKDPEKKEHPCFVPYEQLPREQQAKDYIFRAVVRALAEHV
ncbi:MAG: RyR domain-containing protein [Myxococcales bacterium]